MRTRPRRLSGVGLPHFEADARVARKLATQNAALLANAGGLSPTRRALDSLALIDPTAAQLATPPPLAPHSRPDAGVTLDPYRRRQGSVSSSS
ncbi:hypothetical protein [Streptomyces sp. N50]|uniref:hypothetical protein n=1 Tax=Streptomyces sp. N50 TaxID=3081765 RepID=UPI0029625797|nr:hypothetical protein [Streptomyces sp. N50]WOX07476.1 hypothetical protein R2B38_00775 [Streptomyces sp. N50]